MKELIKSVSEDLAKSIIEESFIDVKSIQIKIETSLKIILSKSVRPFEVNLKYMYDKLRERNIQARRDAIEKNFWKDNLKIYVGDNIQPYYDRLNILLEQVEIKT